MNTDFAGLEEIRLKGETAVGPDDAASVMPKSAACLGAANRKKGNRN
ncbi:MAG: hypothetical protein Q8K05_11675 [Polaromonas sp.]|nr:hypothetical protein [Polaromonas sp.]MDP2256698.1 hypothetical protein [Polaromonas sp.]